MPRHRLLLAALFAMGLCGYSYLSDPAPATQASSLIAASPPQPAAAGREQVVSVMHSEDGASHTMASDTLARWIGQATDDDPETRATAIAALATAPRSQAIPILQRVLNSGEPTTDRPLALNSLYTLALQQGDADGAIRHVLRQVTYHGDDEAITHAAQTVLDDVENGLDFIASSVSR